MSKLDLLFSILAAALLIWATIKMFVHRYLTVDESILSSLKLLLRHRAIDPKTISNLALIDVIKSIVADSKQTEEEAESTDQWHFVSMLRLEREADLIADVVLFGPHQYPCHETTKILMRHGFDGLFHSLPLSVEKFIELSKAGILHAELERRYGKRDTKTS